MEHDSSTTATALPSARFDVPPDIWAIVNRGAIDSPGDRTDPNDIVFVELMFEPWCALLEWMVQRGFLIDCSTRLLCEMLHIEEELLRPRDIPRKLHEDVVASIEAAASHAGISNTQVVDRWNHWIVPQTLVPALLSASAR